MPSLLIIMPLFAILLMNMPVVSIGRRLAFWIALALFVGQIAVTVSHHPLFWAGETSRIDSFFRISFMSDHLSFLVLLAVGIVSIASLVTARCTMFEETDRFKFTNLLVISSIGMSGIAIANDIFSLYVFIEITALSSFVLVAFGRDILALEGAFKYFMASAIATALMLLAIALIVMVAGSTSFEAISAVFSSRQGGIIATIAVGLCVSGFMIKSGIFPFYGWLPDAYMSAPAASSVLLAGAVTKVTGIYAIIRIFTSAFLLTMPVREVLLIAGTLTLLAGAFAAIGQKDFKRMLAYSSISQIGYIALGLATASPLGVAGAALHLFNHAIFKSLLFANSSSVENAVGTTDMSRMGGLSTGMPVTSVTSVIGMLSAAGVPPLAGFWSKLMIVVALWQSGNTGYAAVAVAGSAVTLAYLLLMQRMVFFGKVRQGLEDVRERRDGIALVSACLAGIALLVGIFFPLVFGKFIYPIKGILVR